MSWYDKRIGIAPRTPFVALFRVPEGWIAWTAVKDTKAPYSRWQGTYLHMMDSGHCFRVTIHPDYSEDSIHVYEP